MVEVSILQIEIPVRKAEFSSTSLEKICGLLCSQWILFGKVFSFDKVICLAGFLNKPATRTSATRATS